MKILVVTHAYPPEGCGGTERYAEATARGLLARGHDVVVFSGSLEWRPRFELERRVEGPVAVARVHRSDLYFDHWDKVGDPRVAELFEAELDAFRPDVVHLHHWIRLRQDLVRRAAARAIPTVVHLHDLYVTCPRVFRLRPGATPAEEERNCDEPLGRAACLSCVPRWSFQRDDEIGLALDHYASELSAELAAATRCLAPSASHARRLRTRAPSPFALDVLPHPRLPGGVQAPSPRARSPQGELRVLFFATLVPMKGAHVVLEAMRQLGQDNGISLDVHGAFATPAYEARLRALAQGQQVRFHGGYVVDEPCRTPADVVVVPSLAPESYSFWLDEAGRTGLPIVAAASGAIPERVAGQPGRSRVKLVAPGDVAALASALRELRDDLAAREALAAGNAPEGMDLEEHLAALEACYAAALQAGAPAVAAPAAPAALRHDWDRRELLFRELLRSDGWEALLARQQAELEALRREKSGAPPGSPAERGGT